MDLICDNGSGRIEWRGQWPKGWGSDQREGDSDRREGGSNQIEGGSDQREGGSDQSFFPVSEE